MNSFQIYSTKIVTISLLIYLTRYLSHKYSSYLKAKEISHKLKKKQDDVAKNKSRFRTKYPKVTSHQNQIISMTYNELRKDLQNGTLSSVEVTEAFLAKAVEVDQKTNAVTEFLEDALERAEQLDRVDPGERGPMHGIPISLKEHIHLSGLDCTVGIPSNLIHPPPEEDATLVQMLKQLGVVPFCRTNLSQAMYTHDCKNPIFGKTTNFKNKERTPGGSSGGEGALIAGGGSILGIGSDVGGSVRSPAMFSGITSLKPTSGRLPLSGQGSDGGYPGGVGLYNSLGFMASSVEALNDAMSQVCSDRAFDRMKVDGRLVPLPWNEDRNKQAQKLRIGWYDFDGLLKPTPGCQRAVKEAKKLLENQGHFLVAFRHPCLDQVKELYCALCNADEGIYTMKLLEHGTVDHSVIGTYYKNWIQSQYAPVRLMNWALKKFGLSKQLFGTESVELWELNAERLALVEKILGEWNEQNLDVIIAPGMEVPALTFGYAKNLSMGYTMVYNVLDFSAGSITVTEEMTMDQEALEMSYPGYERSKTYGLMKEGSRGALGMPLNVQVIGRPWSEELVLRVMREIENRRAM